MDTVMKLFVSTSGDGGREAFLGHGTRHHEPEQARRWHP